MPLMMNVAEMLSITMKSRHDSHANQYNRIIMVKLLLVSSFIMGLSWFNDKFTCIVPDAHALSGDFVSSACWIQGVYIYKELQNKINAQAYYGIPKDMESDGVLEAVSTTNNLHLCRTTSKLSYDTLSQSCRPMQKTFFLQYQWMPFFVACLTILYYLPYVAFRSNNGDLISLKNTVKGNNPDASKIAKHYFNSLHTPSRKMIFRILFNILIEILYIIANLVTLLGLDNMLNGEYVSYGAQWIQWTQLNNTMAFDYMGKRDSPKPGNALLPPFGYCEVYEAASDVKQSIVNKHKFVCELSQNILYQYVLIVLWFAVVFGIFISVIGLILLFVHYAIGIFGIRRETAVVKKMLKTLSFRELEYLEFIRKRNVILYQEVLNKLRDVFEGVTKPPVAEYSRNTDIPMYPRMASGSGSDNPGVRYGY